MIMTHMDLGRASMGAPFPLSGKLPSETAGEQVTHTGHTEDTEENVDPLEGHGRQLVFVRQDPRSPLPWACGEAAHHSKEHVAEQGHSPSAGRQERGWGQSPTGTSRAFPQWSKGLP